MRDQLTRRGFLQLLVLVPAVALVPAAVDYTRDVVAFIKAVDWGAGDSRTAWLMVWGGEHGRQIVIEPRGRCQRDARLYSYIGDGQVERVIRWDQLTRRI
jgi:hypothetical protein